MFAPAFKAITDYERSIAKDPNIKPGQGVLGPQELAEASILRMASAVVALVTLACTFGGAMLGLRLRQSLPSDYVSGDSRDSIKLIMGLVATMTALILGLVTASAKSSYDAIDSAVKQASISLLALDRELRSFGPETSEIRRGLKRWTEIRVDAIWPEKTAKPTGEDAAVTADTSEGLADAVRELTPANNAQRAHKAQRSNFRNGWSRCAGS